MFFIRGMFATQCYLQVILEFQYFMKICLKAAMNIKIGVFLYLAPYVTYI